MINYSTIKLFLTRTSNFSSRDQVIKIICRNQNCGTKGVLSRCQIILWQLLTCHFTRTSQRRTRPNLRSFPVRLDPTPHGTALLWRLLWTATVKHRTLHVMRLTLVSKLYCSGSLALGSSHVKTWTFDLGLSIHRKFIMNDHFRYFLAGILDGHTQRLSQPRGSVIYANFRALL